MTLANVGFLLLGTMLGALLVSCGVLVTSLADRLQGRQGLQNIQRSTLDVLALTHRTATTTAPSLPRHDVSPRTINPGDTIFVPDEDPAATHRGIASERLHAPR